MATSIATISVNFNTSMSLTLAGNIPAGTVTVSGKDVSLLPQSTDENQFDLTFQAGSGVSSVNGLTVTSISSSSVSVTTQASSGVATATCSYSSFQSPAPTAAFQVLYIKANGHFAIDDPTIVFNPPSGVGVIEIEDAAVAAKEVLA
jgi:hypothetical protein